MNLEPDLSAIQGTTAALSALRARHSIAASGNSWEEPTQVYLPLLLRLMQEAGIQLVLLNGKKNRKIEEEAAKGYLKDIHRVVKKDFRNI